MVIAIPIVIDAAAAPTYRPCLIDGREETTAPIRDRALKQARPTPSIHQLGAKKRLVTFVPALGFWLGCGASHALSSWLHREPSLGPVFEPRILDFLETVRQTIALAHGALREKQKQSHFPVAAPPGVSL